MTIICTTIFLFGAASASGFDPVTATAVERGMDFCFRQRYDSAAAAIAPLISSDPAAPAGYYWQSALIQMQLYDAGDPALADSFYRLCDTALALGRRRLAIEPTDATVQFYCGMTQLNRANCQNWQQRRLAAANSALDANGYLRAAASLGGGHPDFEYGLGMLQYLQDWLRRRLVPLGVTRPVSLALVNRAASTGRLCRLTAEYSYAWLLGEEGRHDSAVVRCRMMLGRYPGNRSVLRLMRDNYVAAKRYGEAVSTAREIDRSIRMAFPRNRYGIAENWIKLACAFEGMGRRDSAVAYAERVIAWEHHAPGVPWLASYVREAKRVKARARK